MTLPFHLSSLSNQRLQARLLKIAAAFLAVYAAALTLSPLVRTRSLDAELRWGHWLGFAVWLAAIYLAQRQLETRLPNADPFLLPIAALLTGWGLLTIWRLNGSLGLRQTLWLAVGFGLFALGTRLQDLLGLLRRYKYLWLTGGLALTGLTLWLGSNPLGYGPRLWLGCCGVYIQPSEPLKLLLVIYLAAYLADRQPLIPGLVPLLAPTALMAGLVFLLLLVQRDLGTATLFLVIYTTVVYAATGKKRVLLVSGAGLLIAGVLGYSMFDLVRLRVDAWLNPWTDPSGRSYQIVQSLMAVASGGLIGRGPGLGSPGLVPIAHSDFIYASLVEEGGLVAAIALLALLGLLAARGLRIALNAQSIYQHYLAVGLTTFLIGQSVIIIGGNLRLLPLTGVTLPFLSYGGSSLATCMVALLLLARISNRGEEITAPRPKPAPTLHLGAFLLAGLGAAGLATGWWAAYRGPDLLARTDNARRSIADRYLKRGALLDRDGQPLTLSQGEPGDYQRVYLHPALGPVLGYTHPIYGQSGLEASLDPILRGLEYQPTLTVWVDHLLYGQPPPGADLRLSLDSGLQSRAEELLDGESGAVVLLDAASGEVLVMASSPSFDPNRLDDTWEGLVGDDASPLLNRAAQGRYPPGTALGPFILAAALGEGPLPELPETLSRRLDDRTFDCARLPTGQPTWNSVIANGCPEPLAQLGLSLGGETLLALYQALGLYTPPPLRMETFSQEAPATLAIPEAAATGQNMLISPLQLALAAAGLSNNGVVPGPQIALEVGVPVTGWQTLPPLSEPIIALDPAAGAQAAERLASTFLPIWEALGLGWYQAGDPVTWYLAGTLPGYDGAHFALVVLLESNDPALAEDIGQIMLDTIIE